MNKQKGKVRFNGPSPFKLFGFSPNLMRYIPDKNHELKTIPKYIIIESQISLHLEGNFVEKEKTNYYIARG